MGKTFILFFVDTSRVLLIT